MSAHETFQLSTEAAEAYEATFVPALFGDWAERTVEAARIGRGQAVLDVACGTGAVARAASACAGDAGRVAGVDVNEGMLAVASRLRPDLEWRHGDATALPFPDGAFDAVLCQAALMFVPDRPRAVAEMARVARSGGVVAVQAWSALERQPAYAAFAAIVTRHAGAAAADLLGGYFALGEPADLSRLLEGAGLAVTEAREHLGAIRFGSIDEFVRAELDATPLGERLEPGVREQILADCRAALAPHAGDARTEIPFAGHITVGRA